MTSQKITLRQTNESRKKTTRGAKTFAMRAFSQGHRDQTALRLITKTCAPHDSFLQNADQHQDQIRKLICVNQLALMPIDVDAQTGFCDFPRDTFC